MCLYVLPLCASRTKLKHPSATFAFLYYLSISHIFEHLLIAFFSTYFVVFRDPEPFVSIMRNEGVTVDYELLCVRFIECVL